MQTKRSPFEQQDIKRQPAKHWFRLSIISAALLAGHSTVQAATVEVRSLEDGISSSICTLRGAAKVINEGRIDLANNACTALNLSNSPFGINDSIIFYARGTLTLSSPVEIRKTISLSANQNIGRVTLSGGGRNGILRFIVPTSTPTSPAKFNITVRNINFVNAGPATPNTTGGLPTTSPNAAVYFQSTIESSSLLIEQSDFSGNQAESIFAANVPARTNFTFRNTNFADNPANQSDSMIYLYGRTLGGSPKMVNYDLTIDSSTFTNNQARRSPIFYTGAGTLNIVNSTFSNNKSLNGEGGAIKIFGEPYVVTPMPTNVVNIMHSRFIDNQAIRNASTGSSGGAITSSGMKLNISDSAFIGNSAYDSAAKGSGGALYATIDHSIHTGNAINIVRSTFAGNTAGSRSNPSSTGTGAAIFVSAYASPFRDDWDTRMNITHSTFSDNYAAALYGGTTIYAGEMSIHGSNLTLINSNRIDGAPIRSAPPRSQASIFLYNSLIAGNGSGTHCVGSYGITQTGANNLVWRNGTPDTSCGGLIANPSDPMPTLAPLANNGGRTQTHALLPGSPAINAGDPAYTMTIEPAIGYDTWIPAKTDQRYYSRQAGDLPDLGAYETSALPQW